MTNQEIKMELLKAAMASAKPYTEEDIKLMYAWVIDETNSTFPMRSKGYEDKPVGIILTYINAQMPSCETNLVTRLEKVFNMVGIKTVGELISYGRTEFLSIKNIGRKSVSEIDKALFKLYGIESWYKR